MAFTAKRLAILLALFFALLSPVAAADCLDAKSEFGIAADGSDETVEIIDALETSATECVYFGAGIYAFDPTNLPVFQTVPHIETAGMRLTVFRNLSTSSRMFEFDKHTATDFRTAFMSFGGMTIDQNGSTGTAVKAGAMYTQLHDIWVYGQAGEGWAFDLHGITQGVLRNLQITSSSNCLRLSTAYYVRADHVGCERTSGTGILIEHSVGANFTSTYLDNGSVAGPTANEVLKVYNSSSVQFNGLSGEFANGADLTPLWFIKVESSINVGVSGGKVSHSSDNGSGYIFYVVDSEFRLQQFEWQEAKFAMVLIGGEGGNIAARDIITTGFVTGGTSRYGILNITSANRVEVDNWTDKGTPSSFDYVSAASSYIRP